MKSSISSKKGIWAISRLGKYILFLVVILVGLFWAGSAGSKIFENITDASLFGDDKICEEGGLDSGLCDELIKLCKESEIAGDELSKEDQERCNSLNIASEVDWSSDFGNGVESSFANVKNCRIIEGEFNPSSIEGTPYWVTTAGETGSSNLLTKVGQVAPDTSSSYSYGNFGLNSLPGNSAHQFWAEFGPKLGLVGTPGTSAASNSWKSIASSNPKTLALAEVEWYNKYIINPTKDLMESRSFSENIYGDPRVVAYLSDVRIQMGGGLQSSLASKVTPNSGESAESYLLRLKNYQMSDEYLKSTFKTYLTKYPDRIKGLKNRVQKRYDLSSQVVIVKLGDGVKTVCDGESNDGSSKPLLS